MTAAWACVLLVVLGVETLVPGTTWSPYNKLVISPGVDHGQKFYAISANGVPHQIMGSADMRLNSGEHIYGAPYERFPGNSLKDVLIVGAGSGSDVAVALKKGAGHVDAVDIDPKIMALGAELHPDRPYSDPRVSRHVNDGRAFLENTDRKYDLILFALPDSLTLVSGGSQIRLESFLFTRESLRAVREHLKPDGGFAMYNYYREPWLIDRLAGTAEAAFGHPPCVDTYAKLQAVVSIARNASDQVCAPTQSARAPLVSVAPATDDRPFVYFRGGAFPPLYMTTLLCIFVASLVTVRGLGGPLRNMRPYADLFFMGVAFLLLETKNVATFAMLFGTTWLVNALVFAGVLLIVLAAVETTRFFRKVPLPVVFIGIAASLALAWMIKPEFLLQLSYFPRLIAATVLAFLPIFLANVAFSKRFEGSSDSQGAFAVNLLGAILGGCLEYSALYLGYNNLLILTGLLYLAAFLLVPRSRVPG